MTAQTHDTVPGWPKVVAVVREDGSGEVTVNGTSHPVTAGDLDQARAAVLAHVRHHTAAELGRPVRVETSDPQGHWQLIVHPDGSVQDAGEHAPTTRRRTSRTGRDGSPPDPSQAPRGTTGHGSEHVVDLTADAPALDEPTLDETATAQPDTVENAQTAPDTTSPAHQAQVPPADATPGLDSNHGVVEAGDDANAPTLNDLLAARQEPPAAPAEWGWRAGVRRATAGLVKPGPGPAELAHRTAVAAVQRSLDGPRTVVVVNPKGGAHKTTAALLIAATFGRHRGGYTLAWDNNETRGTLGWRAHQARHTNTAVDLLHDLDRFAADNAARVGDLDNYVRSQGSAQFDVLASDEDAASAASIDAHAFHQLHHSLARFYRVMVIDTGNNMRASNWQAAVAAADQLVIVSTVREDTAQSAAWLADALRATGNADAVRDAVTVLTAPARTPDADLTRRLHDHFGKLTRTVLDVPHDPSLVAGGPISYDALTNRSREAWLRVSAAIADGL